jgi:hypothetical protein
VVLLLGCLIHFPKPESVKISHFHTFGGTRMKGTCIVVFAPSQTKSPAQVAVAHRAAGHRRADQATSACGGVLQNDSVRGADRPAAAAAAAAASANLSEPAAAAADLSEPAAACAAAAIAVASAGRSVPLDPHLQVACGVAAHVCGRRRDVGTSTIKCCTLAKA